MSLISNLVIICNYSKIFEIVSELWKEFTKSFLRPILSPGSTSQEQIVECPTTNSKHAIFKNKILACFISYIELKRFNACFKMLVH